MTSVLPTRVKVPVCKKRNNLACKFKSISQISSKNNVPPLAASTAPFLSETAPLKDPFMCPKNSDSNNSPGIAAQFIAIKGASFLALKLCKYCAQTSLPVPLSPVTNTLALLRNALSSKRNTVFIAKDSPINDISGVDDTSVFTFLDSTLSKLICLTAS